MFINIGSVGYKMMWKRSWISVGYPALNTNQATDQFCDQQEWELVVCSGVGRQTTSRGSARKLLSSSFVCHINWRVKQLLWTFFVMSACAVVMRADSLAVILSHRC